MKLAVPRELSEGETRVALVPESVKKLVASGFAVAVEAGAGLRAHFPDSAYAEAGATIDPDVTAILRGADIVLKVGAPVLGGGGGGGNEVTLMRPGAMLLTSLLPTRNLAVVRALAAASITSFSTDAIPRSTRAQAMDT